MDTNKSNVVPFSVIGPVSGQDITDRIILKDIISEGTSVPYFRSNGNDTFEVVNAETTQTVTNTTFKFEIEEGGVNYELEANTSTTINAVTGGTFKVVIVGGGIIGKQGEVTSIDFIPTWRGQPLGLADAKIVITGLEGVATINREELLPDGITHRAYLNIVATGVWNNYYGIRFERTAGVKTVINDGYAQPSALLMVYQASAPLVVTSPYYYTDNLLTAAIGDKLRIYPTVWYNGVQIPLDTPGLAITKSNKSGNTGSGVLSLDGITSDYIQLGVLGPVDSTNKTFTWTYSYSGFSTDVGGGITVPTATKSVIPMTFQNTLVANNTQKAVFKAVNPTLTWTPRWGVDGAIIESGVAEFIDKSTGLRVGAPISLSGLTADQVNRFIQSVTPSWMEQELRISGILGVIRFALANNNTAVQKVGRNPIPMVTTNLTIPAAPYSVNIQTPTIDKTLDSQTNVIATLVQIRDGVPTNIKGSISGVSVSGAGTYVSSSIGTDGTIVIVAKGTGSAGEVSISGTVTENAVAYPFTFNVAADVINIVTTPSPISTKIWETGTTLPFVVMNGTTDITGQITDVQLIPTSYIGFGPDGVGWEVINADSVATTVSAQYTFKYNGITYSGTGEFSLAAWDGKTITISRLPNKLLATVGREESLVFTGTYKGKPHQEFTVTSLGDADVYIGTLSSVPVVDGPGVRFGYTGISQFINTPLTYVIKLNGTAGDVENLNRVTITGNFGLIYPAGLRLDTQSPESLQAAYLNRVYPVTLAYYDGGRRISNTDPDLEVSVIAGVHATANTSVVNEILYNDDDYFYFRIISQAQDTAEYYNRISTTYKGQTDVANWWTYFGPVTAAKTMKLVWDNPAVESSSNDLTGKILFGDNSIPASPTLYGLAFGSTPSNGNALISVTNPIEILDPATGTFKISLDAGHTGSGVTVKGMGKASGYLNGLALVGTTLSVPQSPLLPTLVSSSFNGANGVTTVIEFTLNQKRIDNESFQILAGTLSGNMASSGNGTPSGFKANVVDGNFEFTMTGTGVTNDVSNVTFNLVVEGITYPVVIALNAVEVQDNATVVFDPTTVSGLYGESFTTGVVMTKNAGGVVDLTDAQVRVSPTGIINPVGIGADGFNFTLLKDQATDRTDTITVVITGAAGDQATATIDVTTLNNKLWATPEVVSTSGVGVNDLYFTLKDAKGQVVTDVTLVSIASSVTDFNSVYDFNTSSNFFKDAGTPGRYYLRATVNWKDNVLNVTSTVKQGAINRIVEGLSWEVPLSPITVEVAPINVIKENPDYTPVVIKFIQQRWNGSEISTEIEGTYTGVVVTGAGEIENGEVTVTGGVFGANVRSNGVAGSINISGVLNATNPAYNMGVIPFEILSITNPMVLAVNPNHAEGFPDDILAFDYLLSNDGVEVDTTGSSMTLTPGGAFGSYTLDTANKKVGFKITKAGQPETEVIDTDLTLSKSGTYVKAGIKVTIYGYKLSLTAVSSKTLLPGQTNTVTFDLTDEAGQPAVGATFSTVTCNSPNDSIVAILPAEVTPVDGTPGRYSFKLRTNNTEGYGEVSVIGTYKGGTTLLVGSELTYINPGSNISVQNTTSAMTLKLWESKLLNYDVMVGTDVINDTVTDVTITNQTDVDGWIEVSKGTGNDWSLKAIKASKTEDTIWNLNITVNGVYLGNPYSVNFDTSVTISLNDSGIPENRFNIEFL